jgi:hypothetical protein
MIPTSKVTHFSSIVSGAIDARAFRGARDGERGAFRERGGGSRARFLGHSRAGETHGCSSDSYEIVRTRPTFAKASLAGPLRWGHPGGRNMTTDAKEFQVTDPDGLLENGEEAIPLANLAAILGCSNNMLRELLRGPLRTVRWARREPAPAVYSVADARAAFEPHRAELEARRLRAIEVEASGRAARAARIAAADAANAALRASQKPRRPGERKPAKKGSPPRQTPAQTPEVIVLARRPSVRP